MCYLLWGALLVHLTYSPIRKNHEIYHKSLCVTFYLIGLEQKTALRIAATDTETGACCEWLPAHPQRRYALDMNLGVVLVVV